MELKIIDGLFETRAVNADKRSVDAVMSTAALDRFDERIAVGSWEKRLSRFKSSPVLLKDHDHTKPIGHWENVSISKEGLVGTAVFATTPEADERFVLHRDGHVKSFSVGFVPHKWSYQDEVVEGKAKRIKVYEDCELLECSSVAVGANPEALQRLMRTFNAFNEGDSIDALLKRSANGGAPLIELIESCFDRKMKQLFHAGPGGLMATLAMDIAELVVCGGPGMDEDDIPDLDEPGPETASDGQERELKAALLEALGKAG